VGVAQQTVETLPAGGRFLERKFSNSAGIRSYKLYVPSRYSGHALPLVVMLHGCTQNPDDFAAGTRMNILAEARGFLVVYPRQPQSANMQKCWNWFSPENQQRDAGEASLIAGITRQVIEEYKADPARIYVQGSRPGAPRRRLWRQPIPIYLRLWAYIPAWLAGRPRILVRPSWR
jgi:poly(3-hydroxybutyrate) depolymerase